MIIMNEKLDEIALKVKINCHCCDRPAIKGKGRIFLMGYWLCNECESTCEPEHDECSITGHYRMT